MIRTGTASLPMHWGKAPKWLFTRMTYLSREICTIIIEDYGPEEMLNRLSDPFWFQSFGCVLGFDWHSSGLTTTVCAAIKEGLRGSERQLQFFSAGGKGRTSRKTPSEIRAWMNKLSPDTKQGEDLVYASKMSAKIDSAAIQDGYQLYHHSFFFTQKGQWAVVQQGMNTSLKSARRYHWLSKNVSSFVKDPDTAICSNHTIPHVLNLVSTKSAPAQHVIHELSIVSPSNIIKEYKSIYERNLILPRREPILLSDIKPQNLEKILLQTYEKQPSSFEEFLSIKGVGPKTLRALTLISEIAYGTMADWEDPAKYSFAHGGKDGYPYPVNRSGYDTSIRILHEAIQKARIDKSEKRTMLLKLFHQ